MAHYEIRCITTGVPGAEVVFDLGGVTEAAAREFFHDIVKEAEAGHWIGQVVHIRGQRMVSEFGRLLEATLFRFTPQHPNIRVYF